VGRKPVISDAILGLLQGHDRHAWTIEELRSGLSGGGLPADFSSVFRAAERLAADGLVRKVTLDDGRARFELVEAHHDHLHCIKCGELVAIPCMIGPAVFAALERETGVAISGHHVVLSGLCRECHAP
jgi:Fe2+ or Zn2+ uptake regulation protein